MRTHIQEDVVCVCVRARVRACVRERERERESVCVGSGAKAKLDCSYQCFTTALLLLYYRFTTVCWVLWG